MAAALQRAAEVGAAKIAAPLPGTRRLTFGPPRAAGALWPEERGGHAFDARRTVAAREDSFKAAPIMTWVRRRPQAGPAVPNPTLPLPAGAGRAFPPPTSALAISSVRRPMGSVLMACV